MMNSIRKLLVGLFVSVITIFGLITLYSTDVKADNGPVEIGYLLDEDFSFLNNGFMETVPSGWDVRRAGGGLTFSYNNWFKISDTSSTLPVSMSKMFVTQSEGSITLEYRFKAVSVIDGVKWQLRNGEIEGVAIVTSGSNLALETPGGLQILQAYSTGVEYGVKVVTNISANTADVYVNGVLKAANASFKNTVSSLNGFQIITGGTSTGDLYFSPVKIYKGYVVNETFISVSPGSLPEDWQTVNTGGTIAVEEVKSATMPDVYSLKLDGSVSTSGVSVSKSVYTQPGKLIFEYKMLIPQKTDGLSFELRNGSNSAVKLVTANGKLNYINSSGEAMAIYDYVPNVWYAIKVKLNVATSKADFYVNGKLQVQGTDFAIAAASLDAIQFTASSGNHELMYVDDIMLYEELPETMDYVPAPVMASSSPYEIGVQACSMWREGQHLGWDVINSYPERIPYLGFYDEGSPETADWEIKWMVEHGITFEQYCWFRPRGNEGLPIKDPKLGSALHEGFFNAKYSDQMKFTIMWENANSYAKDSDDFRNNLIPYWIEYYFKDPRYLIIDNKPVLSIYSLNGLKRDFGGTLEGVKAEIDYLRSAVQAAGFEDVILITAYSGTDTQSMTDMKTVGLDAIFAYTREGIGGHAALQQFGMTQERDAGAIDVLPALSMGRDDTAWGGSPGYYTTSTEFQGLAGWVKDTFMPSLPIGNLGKKVVMLDNWNEFGEGHYIMPASLAGFGYLDAIRNVFTTGGSHSDAVPTQEQKRRINSLYPADRLIPNRTIEAPPLTNQFIQNWGFDTDGDSEGWSLTKQIDNLTVQNGVYSGTSTGVDPGIISADKLGISVAEATYMKIRMSSSASSTGQVYFVTDTDANWNEAKSVKFYVERTDAAYADYYVPMWQNKLWIGRVIQIRIDPMVSPGSFSFDSIGLLEAPFSGIKLSVDGNSARFSHMSFVADGSVMVPAADVLQQIGATTEWDPATKTVIAVKSGSIIRIKVDDINAFKDSQAIALEHAPILLTDGTVMMPAALLNQAFGYIVNWDAANQRLSVRTKSVTWDFNSNDGWTANNQVSGVLLSGGVYNGISTGIAPAITSPELNIEASAIKRIRVNYKNGTTGDEAKIYYTTVDDPIWDEAKAIVADVFTNDTDYKEYVFDTTGLVDWTGTIKQIRFVPAAAAGDFSIDYVKLDISTQLPVKGDNIIVDPGFEDGTLHYSGYQISREFNFTETHSGHASLKVTKSNGFGSLLFPVAIEKGKTYYYSAWAKLASGSTAGEVLRFALQYKVDGVQKQFYIITSPALSTADWKQVQGTYTINETGNVTNVVMFTYTDLPAAIDSYYIDDVELRSVTYTEGPEWIHVSGVSLNKSLISLYVGQMEALTTAILPFDAVNKDMIWSSDDTGVAIVDVNGAVYGKSVGTAHITVTTVDGVKSTAATVTVRPYVPVTEVSLNKTMTLIPLGLTETLVASLSPGDASEKTVIWSSDNDSVASVNSGGTVLAKVPGTAHITVTTVSGGKTAVATVTVPSNEVRGDNLITDSGFEDNTIHYSGWQITKQLSTTQYHSGLQSLGITKTNGYGSIHFPAAITNGQPYYYSAWAKLATGSTTGEILRLCLEYQLNGVTKQLIILTSPALNATNWKQVQGYYTINETGSVTNVKMYLYTDQPAATDMYYLDDVEIRSVSYAVTGVSLNSSALTISQVGGTASLAATLLPANATNKSMTWSTSNSMVASVDANGVVTAVGDGVATITVTTADGGYQKKVSIVVDSTHL